MYGIPVEVLRDGFPVLLRGSPDDEVRGGNLMRVATADGLAVALSERAPGSDALQVYVVSYMAPREAQDIEEMAEATKTKQSEGAAAGGPAFVIANERLLQAKVLALMAMKGEIANINLTMQEVRAKEAAPYYIPKDPLVDHGLSAGEHLKPLKQAYFARRALSAHFNIAKATLKCTDHVLFESLLKSFPMTAAEQQEQLMVLAKEYQQEYPQHKNQALSDISKQILGLLAFLDLQDKKRMVTSEDLSAISNDRSRILKVLKGQRRKFRDSIDKRSLLGAEFVDFPSLRGCKTQRLILFSSKSVSTQEDCSHS